MFQPSSRPIDPELKKLVAEIEQSPALSVLAARRFRYALSQTSVEVTISQPRKFNVLEEFVFRAGVDLKPSPTQDELATILGLDPIFINSTAANLRKLKTLEVSTEPSIQLTVLGEELYKYQILPDSTTNKITQVYIVLDSISNNIILIDKPLTYKGLDSLVDLAELVEFENAKRRLDNFSLTDFHDLLRANKLSCHDPEDNKIVSEFELANNEIIWAPLSLFVIFDTLENNIIIEARRDNEVLAAESKCLNSLLEQRKISLDTLCELEDEEVRHHCEQTSKYKNEEVEKRIAILTEAIREQNQPSLEVNNINDGTVVLLRDGLISQEFENILNSAKHQVLIYSPWVSKSIINDQFIKRLQKLADNGVWILIGHGIARSQSEEDRPIPPEVEVRLRSILSPEGIPVVQAFWLGRSHAKEIIADRKVHLLGSNNLLSCRASSGLWAESAYKVTIAEQVQEAYEFYAGRFRSKAQELWSQASQNRDFDLAKQAIYLWGALEMEEEALLKLQSSGWSELYPVWIKVVIQGLLSKRMSCDSNCCQTVEKIFNQHHEKDSNINLLQSRWKLVMAK